MKQKKEKIGAKKKAFIKKQKAASKVTKVKLAKKPSALVVRKPAKASKSKHKTIIKKKPYLSHTAEPAKPRHIIHSQPAAISQEIVQEGIAFQKATIEAPVKPPAEHKPLPQKTLIPTEELKVIPQKRERLRIEEARPLEPEPSDAVEKLKAVPKKAEKTPVEQKAALAKQPIIAQPLAAEKTLELNLPITVKDLAIKLQEKPSILIKALMDMGLMAGINKILEEPIAVKICSKYGYEIKKAPSQEETILRIHQEVDKNEFLRLRPPIVTFMGHVDHGKTSLLDAIRKTKVAESEHGGITQHIGAYRVVLAHGEIIFLDTPGHEAFTAMRSRGASITDIVVLVVAADDGIMPQTQEAIDHAKAAGVPIIVAVNKIDKPQADIDRVKKQLSKLNLAAEDWGGKTITVPVSAKTGQGIDELLEMIILEAQMLELKGNPDRLAHGVVIEAKLSKGRGPVATLLVQNGTLYLNDVIIADRYYGKIKAMYNDHGQSVTNALPSFPVEVSGLSGIPQVGEQFFVIEDEKMARELALSRQEKERQQRVKAVKRISLEDLRSQIQEGKIKELKLIIKADVQGSLEAIKETLNKLKFEEIKWNTIHEGVGSINTSDVVLAIASDALILGFHVGVEAGAKALSVKEGVDIRIYNIIYELANDIKAALEGMLEPKLKKVFLGRAEVRKVFKLSRAGIVTGCFVSKGKINCTATLNLIRNGQVIFEGQLSSLKHIKDDVREVQEGLECGMTFGGFEDAKEGDIIEFYDIEKIAVKL